LILKIPILTYTAPYQENTREEYNRKRTSFTIVAYRHGLYYNSINIYLLLRKDQVYKDHNELLMLLHEQSTYLKNKIVILDDQIVSLKK